VEEVLISSSGDECLCPVFEARAERRGSRTEHERPRLL
jgi:hypothetical protein